MSTRMVFGLLFLLSFIVSCSNTSETPVSSAVTNSPTVTLTETPSITPEPSITIPNKPPDEVEQPEQTFQEEPVSPDEPVSPEQESLPVLYYNLPPTQLTSETGLYASPNRAELILPANIPANETVYVMGRNPTISHLRVVWNTGVGWVPVSFTTYNGQRDLLEALPVFEREPPACAEPITTQFNINNHWISDQRQRIAVVIDLFRSRYGDFPPSFLSLTVNGNIVESTRRQIVERGQFSLKDVVFTFPDYIQPGNQLGYMLETTSDEALSFAATIFRVPDLCNWDIQ